MRVAWIAAIAPLALLWSACDTSSGGTVVCYGTAASDCYDVDDGGSSTFDAGVAPVLAHVETGKLLTAGPGNGIGVFVQYATGGHWTVWWTCDSNKSPGASCDYEIGATAKTGVITNIAGYDGTTLSPPDGGVANTAPTFPIVSTVTDQLQGVTFDAEPGATIEVTASLGGGYGGALFYYVDADKIDDGYTGPLTDPIDFEPTSP